MFMYLLLGWWYISQATICLDFIHFYSWDRAADTRTVKKALISRSEKRSSVTKYGGKNRTHRSCIYLNDCDRYHGKTKWQAKPERNQKELCFENVFCFLNVENFSNGDFQRKKFFYTTRVNEDFLACSQFFRWFSRKTFDQER